MAATNLDMLLDVKNAIFVDEIISKTRENGLPWQRAAGDRYSVTICEPPFCLVPRNGGDTWTIVITRLPLTGGQEGETVFSLDVLVNSGPYVSLDSRQVSNVETLFTQAERIVARNCSINRAITFISSIPSSPQTDVSDFSMCGGVVCNGTAQLMANYNGIDLLGGSIVGGLSNQYLMMFPEHSGGTTADGSNINLAVFQPQISQAGAKDGGIAVQTMIWSQLPTGGSKAGGAAVIS